ncbi:hypothetical protein SDC9_94077 [bioreactor metagenome]|uniref:Uncharacterized protein n=1 Tax=bioreactor metagenome TaxID=1076179 RepID=A0A645A3S9_9ZZZZ
MPADGFPFAVRVGREKHFLGGLCLFADALQHIASAAQGDVLRLKIVFNLDPKLTLW